MTEAECPLLYGASPLSDLNEDCLLHVLSFLSVTKRIQLEQVCKRWRTVIRRTFYKAHSVNVAQFMVPTSPIYQTHYQQDHLALTPTATGLISHCAPYVRQLSFGHQWLKIRQPVVDAIALGCHHLLSLDLSGCIVDADILPAMEKLAPKLRSLNLDDTTFVRVPDLHLLFYRFIHLSHLGIANAAFPLRRLVDLPADLSAINLNNVRDLPPATLLQFLHEHPDLVSLSLAGYQSLSSEMLEQIGRLPALHHLDLSRVDDEALSLAPLAQLQAAHTLLLNSCRCLDGKSLAVITARLAETLTSLEIIACKRVFDFSSIGSASVKSRHTPPTGVER